MKRRVLLAGAAAAAVAPVPAALADVTTATDDPALDALIAEYRSAAAAAEAACHHRDAIEASLPDWAGHFPSALRAPAGMDLPSDNGGLSRGEIEKFNQATEDLSAGWAAATGNDPARRRTKHAELGRARLEWWDREDAEIKRRRNESGLSAAEKEADRLCSAVADLEDRICAAPAATLAGVIARLAFIARDTDLLSKGSGEPVDVAVRQSVRDLERLGYIT